MSIAIAALLRRRVPLPFWAAPNPSSGQANVAAQSDGDLLNLVSIRRM